MRKWLQMLLTVAFLTCFSFATRGHQGALRLTAGANLYHQHISYDDAVDDTFYTLKLAPTLLFGKGLRLSSVLIYNSKKESSDQRAHLYASVKMNKDLGKRCNVFADFHDIAGRPTGEPELLLQSFNNRALTIGLTFYPWRQVQSVRTALLEYCKLDTWAMVKVWQKLIEVTK